MKLDYTEGASVYQEGSTALAGHRETAQRTTDRKPRADSLRNRELLLVAAAGVFSAGGPEASLEAVAREAGVGIGTLYRHFPTREALFEAVYRHEVDQLGTLAEHLAGEADPVEALRRWLHANIRLVATKKGMKAALQLAANGSSELRAYSSARLKNAIGLLLDRARVEGKIRPDIQPEDMLNVLVGILYANDEADKHSTAIRLMDVFVDGLRSGPG